MMTSAKFHVFRKVLGVPLEIVAQHMNTTVEQVKSWEEPDGTPPILASECLENIWNQRLELMTDLVDELEQIDPNQAAQLELSIYKDEHSLRRAGIAVSLSEHTAMIGLAVLLSGAKDINITWRAEEI